MYCTSCNGRGEKKVKVVRNGIVTEGYVKCTDCKGIGETN